MSMHILKNSIRKGRVTVDIDAGDALTLKNIELLGDGLKRAIYSRFEVFPHKRVDTGSCGAWSPR